MRKWSKEELDKFIELYPMENQNTLSEIFGRTVAALETKAHNLQLKKIKNAVGKRIFLKTEIELMIEYQETKTPKEIAKILKRDYSSVLAYMINKKMNIRPSQYWWTEEEKIFLKENYENGDKEEIVKILKRDFRTISQYARKNGMTRKDKDGNMYVSGKPLSKKEKDYIETSYAIMSIQEMSKNLNKSRDTIKKYCENNNLNYYKHRKNPKDYSNDFLLEKLLELYKNIGRVPSKEDIQKTKIFHLWIFTTIDLEVSTMLAKWLE